MRSLRDSWLTIAKAGALTVSICATSHAAWGSDTPTSAVIDGLPLCKPHVGKRLEERTVNLTPVGVPRETEVGGVILDTETVGVNDAGIVVKAEAKALGKHGGASFVVTLPPGSYLSSDGYGAAFPARDASFKYDREKNERQGFSRPDTSLWVDGSTLMVNVNYGLGSANIPVPNAQFERLRCISTDLRSLRREILYSGGSKGTIMLEYREFAGDLARPAFSQALTFDLANGKEIGFRGARIRVDSVSNLGIRYTLLKPLE